MNDRARIGDACACASAVNGNPDVPRSASRGANAVTIVTLRLPDDSATRYPLAMSEHLPGLRDFIADLAGLERDDPSLDGALFATGIIDSLNLLELVAHVEKQCGLRVAADELTLDNWNTIQGIEAYVDRRQKK